MFGGSESNPGLCVGTKQGTDINPVTGRAEFDVSSFKYQDVVRKVSSLHNNVLVLKVSSETGFLYDKTTHTFTPVAVQHERGTRIYMKESK